MIDIVVINKLTNEILHQIEKDGIRRCVEMAYTVGYEAGSKSRSNQKEVCQYDLNGIFIQKFDSAAEAERILHIYHGGVTDCCKGKIKMAKQFIFKYGT